MTVAPRRLRLVGLPAAPLGHDRSAFESQPLRVNSDACSVASTEQKIIERDGALLVLQRASLGAQSAARTCSPASIRVQYLPRRGSGLPLACRRDPAALEDLGALRQFADAASRSPTSITVRSASIAAAAARINSRLTRTSGCTTERRSTRLLAHLGTPHQACVAASTTTLPLLAARTAQRCPDLRRRDVRLAQHTNCDVALGFSLELVAQPEQHMLGPDEVQAPAFHLDVGELHHALRLPGERDLTDRRLPGGRNEPTNNRARLLELDPERLQRPRRQTLAFGQQPQQHVLGPYSLTPQLPCSVLRKHDDLTGALGEPGKHATEDPRPAAAHDHRWH